MSGRHAARRRVPVWMAAPVAGATLAAVVTLANTLVPPGSTSAAMLAGPGDIQDPAALPPGDFDRQLDLATTEPAMSAAAPLPQVFAVPPTATPPRSAQAITAPRVSAPARPTTTAAPRATTPPRLVATTSPTRPRAVAVAPPTKAAPPPVVRAPMPPRGSVAAPMRARACPSTLAGTRGYVAAAGYSLAARFGVPVSSILGVGRRATPGSDHPAGYALDFMVGRATGDRLADYVLAHRAELGVTYVIWRQRYNGGRGWDHMADRGSPTANHMDHVHVSFGRTSPRGGGATC